MIEVALLRHWPTEWNLAKRLQGRSDISLLAKSEVDLSQIRLPPPYSDWPIYVSPLKRTRETAMALGLESPIEDERLIEMDFGDFEGSRLDDLRRDRGAELALNENRGLDFRPPNGESPRDVQIRVLGWLNDMTVIGKNITAITHKGVIRSLLAAAFDWELIGRAPIKLDWKALHVFRLDQGLILRPHKMNVALVSK